MADDRMKNKDLNRQPGIGDEQDMGQQQSPGRNPQGDKSTGPLNSDDESDDEMGEGGGGQQGHKGGQGSMGQRR
jgi:hypothetical protein